MATMQSDPLPEIFSVTVFMEGLCTGAARTDAFRFYPSTFEVAVRIVQSAEHNFKSARDLVGMGKTQALRGQHQQILRLTPSLNRWISAILKVKV